MNSSIVIRKSFKRVLLTLLPYIALGFYLVYSQGSWYFAFGFISILTAAIFGLVKYLDHINPLIIDRKGITLGKTEKDIVRWIDIEAVSTGSIMRGGRFVEIELKDRSKRKIAAEYLEISSAELRDLIQNRIAHKQDNERETRDTGYSKY